MKSVDVPEFKTRGSDARLSCTYSLEGAELYSIKWYKGDKQFYQFIPAKPDPKRDFMIPSVHIDVSVHPFSKSKKKNMMQQLNK